MTAPLSLPPACVLYVDGARFADGQPGEPDSMPVALTDLRVNWGRRNTLDQPSPATCTFRVLDIPGGQRFLEKLHLGSRVEVRAEATIYPDPSVSTIPALLPGPVTDAVATGGTVVADGDRAAVVVYPPRAYSSNPSAWDAVPRALAGQTWRLKASVQRPAAFAGWSGWAGEIRPVSFVSPAGPGTVLPDVGTIAAGSGAAAVDLTFVPPGGVWLGFQIRLWPVGPAWEELDSTTWEQLPPGGSPRTNRYVNPRAVDVANNGWVNNRGFGGGGTGTWSFLTGTTGPAGTGITTCRRKTWTVAATTNADTGFNIQETNGTWTPVTPGQTITVSAWLRPISSTGAKYANMVLVFYDRVPVGGVVVSAPESTWATIPSGQWGRVSFTVLVPAGAASVRIVPDIDNGGGTSLWAVGDTLDCTGVLMEVVPTVGSFFDGSTPDVPGVSDYAWTGVVNASTSTAVSAPAVTWDDLARFTLSGVEMLAPAAGAARTGSVFAGRLTDMTARFELGIGGTVVSCTAQDDTAELANRFVGDEPWGAESIGTRFYRIVTASGQAVQWQIDPGVVDVQVSYKDVDRQPATKLLQELAQSVGGALWAATAVASGPFLRLEDINSRAALFVLVMGGDSLVHIVVSDSVVTAGKAVELSACDVLLEPVSWVQDSTDASTRVDVSWREQTVVDGLPKPTDRTVTAVDPVLEAATGQRRVSVSTQLAQQADAQRVADSLLGRLSTPGWRVDGVTWRADAEERLDADKLGVVMQILDGATRLGLGMIFTDLPEWSPSATSANQGLFLEGGVFSNVDGMWTLELLTSGAAAQGVADVVWDELPADWSWDEIGPEISWNDLAGVSI